MRLLHSSTIAPAFLSSHQLEATARVSAESLRLFVQALDYPRHYEAQPTANRRAADYIAGRLASFGCDVERQGLYGNVVGLPAGIPGPLALVCSHYDTVPGTPGADDNSSAVAAMLECARVLQGTGAAVGYACFNREEDGLLGSLDFVEQWVPRNLKRVKVAHVLEMVGYASSEPGSQSVPPGLPIALPDRGDFLGLVGNRDSSAILDATMATTRGVLPEFPVVGLDVPDGAEELWPVLLRSDHAPFWQARLPALLWTDTSEYRNANYHQATDTPDTLDYAFLAKVTRALVAAVR